jgi:hypothetical protein
MKRRAFITLIAADAQAVAVFEESARLILHLERELGNLAVMVGSRRLPVKGHVMAKASASPYLEMADVTATTVGRNARFELAHGPSACLPLFQALFRDVGPPLRRERR